MKIININGTDYRFEQINSSTNRPLNLYKDIDDANWHESIQDIAETLEKEGFMVEQSHGFGKCFKMTIKEVNITSETISKEA